MSNLIYIALNATGLTVIAFLTVRSLFRYGTAALAVQPFVIFSLYLGIIHFFMPIYKIYINKYRYNYEYSEEALLLTSIMSLSTLGLIYLFIRDPYLKFRLPDNLSQHLYARSTWLAGLFMSAVAGLGMYMSSRQISYIGIEDFHSDRILYSTEIGIYSRLSTIILPGIVFLLAGLLNSPAIARVHNFLRWSLVASLIIYSVNYYSVIQSRNSIMLLIITATVTYIYYRPKPMNLSVRGILSWTAVLLVSGALIAVALNLTFQRFEGRSGGYAQSALDNILYTLLDGAFGNDENILWLLDNNSVFYYGKTYLSGFFNVIPRDIWANKPIGAGPELRNLIYPGSYIVGAEGNTSFTTGFLTEAWMNFGPFGILIVGFLWAVWQRKLVKTLVRSQKIYIQALAIFSICFFSSAFMYSEFLGFLGRYIICLSAAMASLMIVRFLSYFLLSFRR